MAGQPSNSVFISYRRDVAGYLALALYQKLKDQKIDAFFDIENLRAGQFEPIILNQISARPYFLPILIPGTLERCVDEGDWVRRELDQAIATHRVIVPVYTPTFDFNDIDRFLPGNLGPTVRGFNAQELPYNLKWFETAVSQLAEEFLVPIQIDQEAVSATSQAVVSKVIKTIEALPSVTSEELSAQEIYEQGLARPKQDWAGKIEDYTKAINIDPQFTNAFINRGVARLEQWRQLGMVKGHQGGSVIDEAIADFDEAIRLDPDSALAYNNRFVANVKRGY